MRAREAIRRSLKSSREVLILMDGRLHSLPYRARRLGRRLPRALPDLLEAGVDSALHEWGGERVLWREVKRALGTGVAVELV